MKRVLLTAMAAALVAGCSTEHKKSAQTTKAAPAVAAADPAYALGFTINDIDGKPIDLAAYRGKVVLVVNVASKCGLTPQYEGLEKLYSSRKDKGLVVLGFPANNFNGQEPGTEAEIKAFCTGTYHVDFPMFSKISVTGTDQHPFYRLLASQPSPVGGDPKWNFHKFVIDRNGRAVASFGSRVKPDDAALVAKIDELLGG